MGTVNRGAACVSTKMALATRKPAKVARHDEQPGAAITPAMAATSFLVIAPYRIVPGGVGTCRKR